MKRTITDIHFVGDTSNGLSMFKSFMVTDHKGMSEHKDADCCLVLGSQEDPHSLRMSRNDGKLLAIGTLGPAIITSDDPHNDRLMVFAWKTDGYLVGEPRGMLRDSIESQIEVLNATGINLEQL